MLLYADGYITELGKQQVEFVQNPENEDICGKETGEARQKI
jgi:hypothetical protein